MRRLVVYALSAGLVVTSGCGGSSSNSGSSSAPSMSEVAASAVSGALNTSGGTTVGWNFAPKQSKPVLHRLLDELSPIGTAYAATWSCTGGTFNPQFNGPGTYAFTPVSCSATWANAKTTSSQWSGTFTLAYGARCDNTHRWIGNQAQNCSLTRTTAPGGNTRTITGPNGNAYAITHDTNGATTGWDTSVSPAPNDGGVVAACASTGSCATDGGTLIINGSHLTGTVTPSGQSSTKIWDHTVSTGTGPMTFTGSATTRLLSGAVTVQHNLAKYTATSTFNSVGFGDPLHCCFPTTGSISTTFLSGPSKGLTETLTFTAQCGEVTLTPTSGSTESITLQHCL